MKKNGLWGFIDIAGEYISSCQWTYARNLDMEANVAQVSDGENWGFIDITGKLVCPCVWEWMQEDFDCGMVMVMDGVSGLFGFLNPEGKQIGGWLTHFGMYREGLAKVCQNEKWGFVRDSGSLAIPCQWDEVRDFSEGFAAVRQEDKWGILDSLGNLVVPCRWEIIHSFQKGILTVAENGEKFRVDIQGNRI